MAGLRIPPSSSNLLAGVCADSTRHYEDQLIGLLVDRQLPEFLDLLLRIYGGERQHTLALEDEAPAILPGHHITPAFAPRLAEVLGTIEALTPNEPQAEALEILS